MKIARKINTARRRISTILILAPSTSIRLEYATVAHIRVRPLTHIIFDIFNKCRANTIIRACPVYPAVIQDVVDHLNVASRDPGHSVCHIAQVVMQKGDVSRRGPNGSL